MQIEWPDPSLTRCCIVTQDDDEADLLLDYASQQLQTGAVLQWRGALISNISIAENLMLSCCWQQRRAIEPLLIHAQQVLNEWLGDDQTGTQWLKKRPAELRDEQRRLMILLRAALAAPTRLLIAPDWFSARSKAKDRSATILRSHFGAATWWWFSSESEHHSHDNWTNWTREQWQLTAQEQTR